MNPLLIVVTDWTDDRLLKVLERVLPLSPRIAVQHRHPGCATATFFREGEQLAKLCANQGNALFINGRLDVALALGAHLHLPAHGLRASAVREKFQGMLSVAVHNEEEAKGAAGADFALVSPVFAPTSKPSDRRPTLGAAGFVRLASHLPCPALALGGITAESAAQLPRAAGMAVMGGLLRAADPEAEVRALLDRGGRLPRLEL